MTRKNLIAIGRLNEEFRKRGWFPLTAPLGTGPVKAATTNALYLLMGDGWLFGCGCNSCVYKTLEPVHQAGDALFRLRPDAQGCRKGSYRGRELWLLPNPVAGFTLMLPEDFRLGDLGSTRAIRRSKHRTAA